jgi:DNA-binding NtrC family response regulator
MGQNERDMFDALKVVVAVVQHPSVEEPPDAQQAGRRVLIVDYDENALTALKRLIGETSYDIVTTRSGLKALQLLCQSNFDLVLLADNLLDMSGEEVVRQVRSGKAGTPVVLMQSAPSDDLAVRYARLGVCFFINRCDLEAIAGIVNDYFSRTGLQCAHSN